MLSLDPLVGEYHRCPYIPVRLLAQAAHARKWHVRPGDHDGLARERWEQVTPRRRRRGVVDVEDYGNVGMTQLDELLMDRVAPKQDLLSL